MMSQDLLNQQNKAINNRDNGNMNKETTMLIRTVLSSLSSLLPKEEIPNTHNPISMPSVSLKEKDAKVVATTAWYV